MMKYILVILVFVAFTFEAFAQGVEPTDPRPDDTAPVSDATVATDAVLWLDPEVTCVSNKLVADQRYHQDIAVTCLVEMQRRILSGDARMLNKEQHIDERRRLRVPRDHSLDARCPMGDNAVIPGRKFRVVEGQNDNDPERKPDDPSDSFLYCLPRTIDVQRDPKLGVLERVRVCGIDEKPGEYCGKKR